MTEIKQSKLLTIILASLIGILILFLFVARVFVLRPLDNEFDKGDAAINELLSVQTNQQDLLDQINEYRDGLYALDLVLDARKNVINGYDEDNPYLVFDFTQVLDDLRRLLPKDAKVTKFQINNKGLVTLPVESIDYASLGRVLKSFKDKGSDEDSVDEEFVIPKMFKEVKIPSGAQRTPRQITSGWKKWFENVYSFALQVELDPEFWQNPMPYPDVNPYSYYSQAVRDLTIAGTIEGYPDGYFRPNGAINRAEFFKVVLFEFLSNNIISIEDYKKYIDLSEKDWHYQYIQLASQMGIAEGDEIGQFHPDQEISRLEALKTILMIFDVELAGDEPKDDGKNKKPLILPFTDISPKDDSYPIISTVIKNGFFSKAFLKENSYQLKPAQSVTRAEIAYWVWKLKFDFLQ